MDSLVPNSTDLNDESQTNTPDEIGPIQYPEGLTAEWIISKTKHLNKGHETWFANNLLSIQDNYKLYEGKAIGGSLPNATNIPVTTGIVDTMTSRTVQGLVMREKFVDAIGLDPETQIEGDYDKQGQLSDFINESITNTPDFADKVDETIKTLFLENVTALEVKWSIDKKTDYKVERGLDPTMQGPGPIVSQDPIEYDMGHPDFVPLSIRMCAWDPRCKNRLADSPWFRKRTMSSINELFRMQEEGIIENVEDVTKKSNKSMTPENPTDPDAKQSQAVDAKQLPSIGWDDGVWEVDTWWADLAWKNEAGEWQRGKFEFWIVGGDTVVKFRANILVPQRIPIVTIKSSRKPGQLMAQGPVDVIKDMQRTLNNNVSNLEQLIKNASYSPTFYEPSSGLDGRRTSLQSNSMIAVLSVKGIQRFEPATAAIQLIENWIRFIIERMQESTAATDNAQGIDQSSGKGTATEAQILSQGSNSRFGYIIEMINASMFGGLGIANEYFLLWKQFGEPGRMVVKDGSNDGKGYQMQPEDMKGCYIFKPTPTQSQQAKLQHFQQLKGLMQDLMQIQGSAPQYLKDSKGQQKQIEVYSFVTEQMLPLVGVQPRGLFGDAPPPPPPQPTPPEPPRVSLSINGQDAVALGLGPAIQKEFGVEQAQPMPDPMAAMQNPMEKGQEIISKPSENGLPDTMAGAGL